MVKDSKLPFYGAKGSDQNAPMKGDHPQQVTYSTKPGTRVKKPKPVKTGGAYKIPRVRRGE
jgi:hypothetical protein